MRRNMPNKVNRIELDHLEGHLGHTLFPVTPRAEFVDALRDKLSRVELKAEENLLEKEPRALHLALLGGAGILSSLLLLITGVRAVIALIGAIGALKQMRQQLAAKPQIPAPNPTP